MLKKILPKSLRTSLSQTKFATILAKNYYYDFQRYLKFSASTNHCLTKTRHQGRIIAHYHVIEKGLSLKEPRVGFGVQVVNSLVSLLKDYQNKYGLDEIGQVALNTLFSYHNFNLERGHDNPNLYNEILKLKETISTDANLITDGGVCPVNKSDIKTASSINFREFVNSRYSVRNFASGEVSTSLIEDAISMALKTPSVCNRQTWKVHLFSDDLKLKALSYQNGNRGFGNTANKVLVVTSDLNYFLDASERNQSFIDGGMFAMSLIYALHSLGVGTCCLNWSVTFERDRNLKREVGISDSETIVMMIAVGNLPSNFYVAQSHRRKVEEVLTLH